ncbi:MAG TPA: outer membrane beta-barrel protein [Bryobacteraceae bacterium]|nr:outer membrane beta-barrel protein [Bryobacteraceae bacterium]
MRILTAAVLLLAMFTGASAQKHQSHGYWYVAPGAASAHGFSDTTVHFGGGGEYAFPKGVGAGVELGAVGATAAFRDTVIGVASANGYYHVTPGRWEKFDPFGTVGYSLLFRGGTANAVNYGAGMNYWFRPGLAARVEFRDHYGPKSQIHWWGFRFGLSFSELWP